MKKYSNKKLVVGISGPRSNLAKIFLNKYKKKIKIKKYNNNINNISRLTRWINLNKDINCFVNFAAIVERKKAESNKKKSFITNYISVKKMINLFNKLKLNNFMYFLSMSSCHVFTKSKKKISEKGEKKAVNHYGYTKLKMENYILNNINKFEFNIGIARIFSFYNKNSTKSFFIEDIKKKLSDDKNYHRFEKVNTKRDFIHTDDIISSLYHMINLNLKGDFNICTGKGILLKDIIVFLNKKNKKKNITFDNIKLNHLIGSNKKILKTGWKPRKKIGLNYFE